MARSKKLKHTFEIVKPDVKQSAYLLLWYRELDIRRNEAGSLSVDLEDIEKSSGQRSLLPSAAQPLPSDGRGLHGLRRKRTAPRCGRLPTTRR